ncbi:MAG: MgtC/SapB family protein [Planctomycetota bacterium]|jgi:putative Mg2+ transporter-C (MgtC) family protein
MDLPEDLISILLAVIFGGAIGLEREISGKAAGLRTNVLICLGAAVFTVISREMGSQQGDSSTRIAAQIVTGVGFLGAGAIIQDRGGIQGLTTAALIWLVASIGMACGAGFHALAVISTFIAIVVLIGLGQIEKPLGRYGRKHKPADFAPEQDQTGDNT